MNTNKTIDNTKAIVAKTIPNIAFLREIFGFLINAIIPVTIANIDKTIANGIIAGIKKAKRLISPNKNDT